MPCKNVADSFLQPLLTRFHNHEDNANHQKHFEMQSSMCSRRSLSHWSQTAYGVACMIKRWQIGTKTPTLVGVSHPHRLTPVQESLTLLLPSLFSAEPCPALLLLKLPHPARHNNLRLMASNRFPFLALALPLRRRYGVKGPNKSLWSHKALLHGQLELHLRQRSPPCWRRKHLYLHHGTPHH